jgi:hypothetical protein
MQGSNLFSKGEKGHLLPLPNPEGIIARAQSLGVPFKKGPHGA